MTILSRLNRYLQPWDIDSSLHAVKEALDAGREVPVFGYIRGDDETVPLFRALFGDIFRTAPIIHTRSKGIAADLKRFLAVEREEPRVVIVEATHARNYRWTCDSIIRQHFLRYTLPANLHHTLPMCAIDVQNAHTMTRVGRGARNDRQYLRGDTSDGPTQLLQRLVETGAPVLPYVRDHLEEHVRNGIGRLLGPEMNLAKAG